MKERLTGAIILVAVLVLLVPELLSGPGESFTMQSADAEGGAPLRSYTIDLADGASARAAAPTSAPATAVTDEPVAMAAPESGDAGPEGSPTAESGGMRPDGRSTVLPGASVPVESGAEAASSANGSAAAETASRAGQDRAAGSGADRAAATPENVTRGSAASPGAEDDRPRSAFGPHAVQRPKPASSESGRAAASSEPSRPAATREATRPAASGSGRAASSEAPRTAASDAKPAKGWAVQLGVFASRDNADRLAKQVKGKGYTVSVNETSANGKRLYRVRVGPEASRTAAEALGAKLRAAGHPDGAVVAFP